VVGHRYLINTLFPAGEQQGFDTHQAVWRVAYGSEISALMKRGFIRGNPGSLSLQSAHNVIVNRGPARRNLIHADSLAALRADKNDFVANLASGRRPTAACIGPCKPCRPL
jgi:hypothetical protein